MIPYLHEKIQEIRFSRFLENRLTNSLHINYYSTKLIGPCPLGTGVKNRNLTRNFHLEYLYYLPKHINKSFIQERMVVQVIKFFLRFNMVVIRLKWLFFSVFGNICSGV